MTSDFESARDDLAFLRGLVGEGSDTQQTRTLGAGYFAGGLCYGGQMLLHAAQGLGFIPQSGWPALAVGFGPTLIFVPWIIWIVAKNRTAEGPSIVSRAVGRVFGAIGLANFVLIAIFATVALRKHSLDIWLIYPCTVFVLQGTAWLFAFMMRRRLWHGIVALGWFVCALGMGFTISTPAFYVLFAGIGLWFFMALPGYVLMRHSGSAA
jgi:hypothetical protein